MDAILAAADSIDLLQGLDKCSTVLAENLWPMRDHPALQAGSTLNTAYSALRAMLFKRADSNSMSKEQKESFLAKQADFRKIGTFRAP